MPRSTVFEPGLPQAPGQSVRWTRLYGSSRGLALAQAAARLDRPLVVIAADTLGAQRLEEELRFYGGPELPVSGFPDWETLPYDHFSPYQDIVSARLATLAHLPDFRFGALVVPMSTVMHRLAPREYVTAYAFELTAGERLDVTAFRDRLERGGYRHVSQVIEHGDYSVRGAVIDVFPMGSDVPYRIDLDDERVESLRVFDPETQRSIERVAAVRLLPAREFPLTEQSISRFRTQWRIRFEGRASACPIYNDVSQGLAPAGIEYYLPLFFEHTATLFDYLPEDAVVALDMGADSAADRFWAEAAERFEQSRHDVERPIIEPEAMFLPTAEVLAAARRFAHVDLSRDEAGPEGRVVEYGTVAPVHIPVDARAQDPLGVLKHFLAGFGGRVLIVAESAGRRETLLDLFSSHGLAPAVVSGWHAFLASSAPVAIAVAPLEHGTELTEPRLAIITETQLFGERVVQSRRRRRSRVDPESIVRNLTELTLGAPVVHEQHGVGRYRGLVTLDAGGVLGEYLALDYADADRLYVPVASLQLISRFSGVDPEHAPLHKLGTGQWQKAKAKAAAQVRDVAAELLEIHARRAARQGQVFPVEHDAYSAFCQGFRFEETPDQITTIQAVLADLRSGRPMDRLVCGDVGFGKTEVAMRACFVTAHAGKQVAVLVPTTLLAQQHHQNFKDRFADWPVRVEHLSRFRARKEQDLVVQGLEDGTVDVVVGTHKLLQSGIRFKRLGLVIIDEEHRFGVRQKEFLKALRSDVHIVTLTATPIPRTLSLALSGTRDLSIIATPPARRLSIKTFVREWNDALLREALLRELSRGGQIYFLHNDIETIEDTARKIEKLAPEARVRVAHGRMRERDLERVMLDFYHQRFNILVCTTIIETGIDVPSANTIVINRADKFGLAQLYQLRGRVGRSHHRAYAYLLVPHRKSLSADAAKRLEAIESLEDLGVGFTLATHDLEIRGAGEILGDEQSGHIQEIGFGLYSELLERAVADLKAGRQPELERPLDQGCEVDLRIPVLLPADYLPDVHARLIMYKRIASASSHDELQELKEETIDRFGVLPPPARNLFAVTEIKLKATPLGVRKVELAEGGGRLHFGPAPNIDHAKVLRLVQAQSRTYKLDGKDRLRIVSALPDGETRINAAHALLDAITSKEIA